MQRKNLPDEGWLKATASEDNGTGCVAVNLTRMGEGVVGVRDSKQPAAGMFVFPVTGWAGFVTGVKNDDFAT